MIFKRVFTIPPKRLIMCMVVGDITPRSLNHPPYEDTGWSKTILYVEGSTRDYSGKPRLTRGDTRKDYNTMKTRVRVVIEKNI